MKSSAELELEVEATRGQIDQTVEALKEKMQPRELFDEATRMMGSTSNKVLTTAVEQIKENPLPLALIGAGVAWLALSQARKPAADADGYFETYEGYDGSEGLGERIRARTKGALATAKTRLESARTEVKTRLETAKTEAEHGLAEARAKAHDGADAARGRIQALRSQAEERAGQAGRYAQTKFQETLDTEPLILAALGLAVGVAIGASLPASRAERRYIGPTRDKLVGRGRELAQTRYEDVKDVAQRAYGQVKDELARQTGPAGEGASLTEKAGALANAGVEAVRDEVEARRPH